MRPLAHRGQAEAVLRKTTIDWAAKESVRAKFCILASESSANTVPESRWWSVSRVMSLGEHDADKARSGKLRATDALASRRFVRMAGPVSAAIRHRVTRQQPFLAAVLQVRNFVPGLSRRKARTFTRGSAENHGEGGRSKRSTNRGAPLRRQRLRWLLQSDVGCSGA